MSTTRIQTIKLTIVLFVLVLAAYSSISHAATIEDTAQIGEPGCDLVEAINAAPTGGCVANKSNVIVFLLNN